MSLRFSRQRENESVRLSTATAPCPSFPVLPIRPSWITERSSPALPCALHKEECSRGGSPLSGLRVGGFTRWWPRSHVQRDETPASTISLPTQNLLQESQTQVILMERRESSPSTTGKCLRPGMDYYTCLIHLHSKTNYFISWFIITVAGIHQKVQQANWNDPWLPMGYLQENWPQGLQTYVS